VPGWARVSTLTPELSTTNRYASWRKLALQPQLEPCHNRYDIVPSWNPSWLLNTVKTRPRGTSIFLHLHF
jgi:hypothetical protein